ncbi:hypothetical protein ABKN59_008440 [Abortiporus biennis]
MTNHSDEHHDAHVMSLRLALGSILSPKRPCSSRSSTATSGTASPLPTWSPSNISTVPSSSSVDYHSSTPSHRAPRSSHHSRSQMDLTAPIPLPQSPPPASVTPTSVVNRKKGTGVPVSSSIPNAEGETPSTSSRSRADFIGTLQSKSAWDALIHGSFV